ncbi:cupin domain-containing protein [Bradyrhizobium sp. 2S1]|uniref:cupin domain-containing protein n=1 Tax=Bradyrhizobium sp. 2S1 TaxID=1404429 RepID=UPI00140B2014|nr:cupin domain-containing protein [Bradyrhizobium sp. 2S1]
MASDLQENGVPVAINRIVTGYNGEGKADVVLDGAPPRTDVFQRIPGMVSRLVWATAETALVPVKNVDPTMSVTSIAPASGETRFLVVTFPPDRVFAAPDFDPAAATEENLRLNPGLAEHFEPDGMHATDSVDYGIVLDGEIWLELDDGRQTCLRKHDVVVQNGTRHA